MRRWRKLWALPAAEWALVAEAALVVVAVRLGLWLVPLRRLNRWLAWLSTQPARRRFAPERIAWAVAGVSTGIPAASCLTQALAARTLLARRGMHGQLRIGVAKDAQQNLLAHAWLDFDGQPLIGGAIAGNYVAFANLEGKLL